LHAAASIWFDIRVVVDPSKKNSISPGKFPKNFDFFQAVFQKFQFFQAISQKNLDFKEKFLNDLFFGLSR